MDLKNTKTEKNIKKAIEGEALATLKYTFFQKQAKKDGYEQIADIFSEIGINEREHAKLLYKLLNNGEIPKTTKNLEEAAKGENSEWDDMYEVMANEAREEGFDHIGYIFDEIGKIESEHEERFKALLNNIEEDKVFNRNTEVAWQCRNCGHIHAGESAPDVCPVCEHPKAYFEIKAENY